MTQKSELGTLIENYNAQFGFKVKEKKRKALQTFTPPPNHDGALFTRYTGGLFYSGTIDLNQNSVAGSTEVNLIDRYREMEQYAEVENAVDEVINELIVIDEENDAVQIRLEGVKMVNESIKKKMIDEWAFVLKLFDFKRRGYDIAKRWYVDGRTYYHLMIDPATPEKGIQEVRYIDPRKIKKVIEPKLEPHAKDIKTVDERLFIQPEYEEYFMYSDSGINNSITAALKIHADAIAYAHSGLIDYKTGIVLSNLHKAIKPFNLLKMLEDAFIIYKISRAPERRIFYIDVSNLPPAVAEKYLAMVADRYKNKVQYDANTGEISNERMHLTMLQDYFLAQREGKGTQIDTLGGGNSDFTDMNQVDYHLKKLYRSLNIPVSRIEDSSPFNMGRPSEITRDEVKFNKFIRRMRSRFIVLLEKVFEMQLVLKKIMTKEEFNEIREDIRYDFMQDNLFTELKNLDMWTGRMALLQQFVEYSKEENGGFFSRTWIKRNILNLTDEDVKAIDKERKKEPDLTNGNSEDNEGDGANSNGDDESPIPKSSRIPRMYKPGASFEDRGSSQHLEEEFYIGDDEFPGSYCDDEAAPTHSRSFAFRK